MITLLTYPAEPSFSSMKRLKKPLRSTMTDVDEVITEFACKPPVFTIVVTENSRDG